MPKGRISNTENIEKVHVENFDVEFRNLEGKTSKRKIVEWKTSTVRPIGCHYSTFDSPLLSIGHMAISGNRPRHIYISLSSRRLTIAIFILSSNEPYSNVDNRWIYGYCSNKGKPLLVYDGYIFKKKKSTEKVTYWICQHGACNATVDTDSNDQYLKSRGNHETHLPSPEQNRIEKLQRYSEETNSRRNNC